MDPEPSQTIHQRAHAVAGPEVPVFSQAVLQMEGNKTSSLSTMRVAHINGKAAAWDLTVSLEVSGLSTARMGACANSCLCWCARSNRAPSSAGFLSARKCKESVPSEMWSTPRYSSTPPPKDAHPRHLRPKRTLYTATHSPATAASWTRHVMYHSCPRRCYLSLGNDDKSVQEDGPGQVTPGTQ